IATHKTRTSISTTDPCCREFQGRRHSSAGSRPERTGSREKSGPISSFGTRSPPKPPLGENRAWIEPSSNSASPRSRGCASPMLLPWSSIRKSPSQKSFGRRNAKYGGSFEAPSAGKTTLARSLTGRLRDRQIPIELWLSYRPAELSNRAATGSTIRRRGPSTVLRRIARPAFEMLNAARNPLENPSDAALSGKLMRILKPRNLLWSLRMRQYMQRLSYAWLRAARSSDIVLFDQGFAQAICSLAVVAAEQNEWRIERALREVPAADLVVR